MIDFVMCAFSVVGGAAILYMLVVSYLIVRPIYKDDAKISERAKKLGYKSGDKL